MYKKILVPTDGSDLSIAAIKGADEFAKPLKASLILLTVIEPYNYTAINEYRPESVDEYDERMLALAQDRLTEARNIVHAAGLEAKTISIKNFSPADTIVTVSEEERCDCIFMASHGRKGLQAVLLGSETQKVLAFSKLPVMVYR